MREMFSMITKSKIPKKIGSIALALFIAAIGALPYILFKDQLQEMAGVGYIGLLAACLLTNASICLPASGIAFTLAATTALNPLWCAVIGGFGTAAGELVGYMLGRFGRGSVSDAKLFAKVEQGLKRYGYFAVLGFAFFPLPIFDLVGIAAGTAKLSVVKFFIVCSIGKILKMLLYVFVLNRYILM